MTELEKGTNEEITITDAMINEINMLRMAYFTLADALCRMLIDKKVVAEEEWLKYLTESKNNIAFELIEEATNAAAQNPNLIEKEGVVEENDYVEVETRITTVPNKPDEEATLIKQFKSIFRASDDPQIKDQIIGMGRGTTIKIKPIKENRSNDMVLTILRVLTLKEI